MTELEQEIKHLDFEVEDEDSHYNHPIDGTIYWCGKQRKTVTDMALAKETMARKPPSEVSCVDCLHLYIEKGGNWWWNVHRAWFGS